MSQPYDPITYWDARASSYAPGDCGVLGENLTIWIARYWPPIDNFLDVGSGEGRIYELVTGNWAVVYHMVDVAPEMVRKCQFQTQQPVALWDGATLPYIDNTFDWVLSFSVLLHVPPADIAQHIAELARVSRRFVFVSTYTGIVGDLAPHCFRHPYERLFGEMGLSIVEKCRFKGEKQTQWLLRKGKDDTRSRRKANKTY
jgi:SAM-dependent methyltransferase